MSYKGPKAFLKLVELQTKVASVVPFIMGTLFAFFYYGYFNLEKALLMLASLLAIDMATTALNNYMDYKRANKRHGYGFEEHNAIVRFGLSEAWTLTFMVALLLVAALFGLWLVWRTDFIVLALGIASVCVGFAYSAGPVPISRTPFGEGISGLTMGGLIPFIAIYIQIPGGTIIEVTRQAQWLMVHVNWYDLIVIGMASLPMITGIANIMLANNICDQAEDIENKRYTLPIFVGSSMALFIFEQLYFLGFLSVALLVGLGVYPLWFSLYAVTLWPTYKNIVKFKQKQEKASTFSLSVKTFLIQGITLWFLLIMSFWGRG